MKAFIVLFLVSFADLSLQASWSYDYETQWPGVCRTGQQQSPINIMTRDAVLDKHQAHIRGPLVFRGYKNVKVTGINNGHTLKWDGVNGVNIPPVLSGGPLRGNYTFLQFHLHWLSEHAIDGMKYPLEIHMVHVKTGVPLDQALEQPDGLAVIGVFALVRYGNEADHALEEIMPEVPNLFDKSQNKTEPFFLDLSRMLSPEPQSYYTYHGSLTTPMCQEVVTWIVMDKPIYITDEQYKAFYNVDVGGSYNYRSLQPANRVVYRSIASCSSILVPSLAGTIVSLLSCLSSSLVAGVNKGICALVNAKRKLFGDSLKQCSKLA
ncbi:carbonic anhydrase 2-like [Anticarsia gemmatalis]|uniref:carbonic anhydrase 2-like n=1 Tax=Anticarsia gemmatalis TaxID=129554 RepID=UPI003F768DC0